MGTLTDRNIAEWQAHAGLEPVTGERREILEKMSETAFELIKAIELEKSGIRSGDGRWYGCVDYMLELTHEMRSLFNRLETNQPCDWPGQNRRDDDEHIREQGRQI